MPAVSVGQLILQDVLPPELGPITSPLDKRNVSKLYAELAKRYPDRYPELTKRLNLLSADVARREVAGSFAVDDLILPNIASSVRKRIDQRIQRILSGPGTDEEKNEKIADMLAEESAAIEQEAADYATQKNNPLALQVISGARGNKAQLKRLLVGDIAYMNHRGQIVPYPVTNAYSAGVKPAEFWAACYGARKGLIDTKLGVADSGYVSKLLSRAAHRLVVTARDSLLKPAVPIGLPTTVDDADNVGALLAVDTGPYKANTIITPKVLDDLRTRGFKNLLVRSPITSQAPSGLYAADVGVREKGTLPELGTIPGLEAAQAIGERLAQTSLSSKHLGGVADRLSGFAAIERMINVPKKFGGAAHATASGKVTKVYKTPVGEHVVVIGSVEHRIVPEYAPVVKVGDVVEAGDVISEGLPNPAEVVRYKGIGEGRRLFVQYFVDAMRRANLPVNRRNVELLARGLIDYVHIDENFDGFRRGDIVPYSTIAASWRAREGTQVMPVDSAVGRYLELPVLHYTIGTPVTPRVIKTLKEFGVNRIAVHTEPAPWTPEMIRAAAILEYDPNWLTRLLGSNQIRALLSAARRGADAPVFDTSYVPAKASGIPLEHWSRKVVQGD